MTVTFSDYYKDASMWKQVKSFTMEMENPYPVLQVLGFKETSHGTYWKRTAYDQAEGAVIS